MSEQWKRIYESTTGYVGPPRYRVTVFTTEGGMWQFTCHDLSDAHELASLRSRFYWIEERVDE